MIEFKNVSQVFGNRVVLNEIDVKLTERRIAIVGSNGSGKSTFARLINGLQLPTSGKVEVDGVDTRSDGKTVRKNVGFVFQNPDNQIVFPLVEEDLAFGLKNIGLKKDQISEKVDNVLRRYNLQDFKSHPAHFLSGGQKQLLAISGVAVMEPRYIVFDEPTTLLDLRNKRKVSEVIRNLEQTAIVISHDLEILEDFDRVLVFEDGKIAIDDQPSTALKRYVEMMA
ncbi:MAG: ATP-binding cassette domain-containing protein [Hyphomicrobiales bacterium]|uniref:energy-coupling factor ABC transporter ATP-binding protein n=1 Tax=Alphaproteobacteria TaxID=28211 RepID=UPI0032666E48